MQKFLKLKARYYLLLFLLMTLIDVLIAIWLFYTKERKLVIVLMVICFLLTGTFFDMFINKVFEKRRNEKLYNEKLNSFKGMEFVDDCLKDYIKRKVSYGVIYTKVISRCLYKLTIINDIDSYHNYNPDEDKHDETPGVNKAIKMVGFELFFDTDAKLLESIGNYSISSSKIYYDAFYLKDGVLVEANHIDPEKNIVDEVESFKKACGIDDKEDNNI